MHQNYFHIFKKNKFYLMIRIRMIFFKHIYRAPHVQCCLMNKAPSNIVNLKNELYIYILMDQYEFEESKH